jgi:hypothetical protein
VLIALLDGPAHGSEIARRAGQRQQNVTWVWLPKLRQFRLVETDPWDTPGLGHQGGGRPARVWELTASGRELAELLRDEDARWAA